MASIKEVAGAAGVSTATVSRVLSGAKVRPGVREAVLAAVQRLDYRPNRAARSLRSARTTTIGLVVADIQNPFFTEVARAVEDVANRAGYAVFLCNSDEDTAKEATYLQLLRDENAAGVIVAPTAEALRPTGPDPFDGLPTVLIDRPTDRGAIDTVLVDNTLAAEQLTTHLIDGGRRRIVGLFGNHSATGRARHAGFVRAHDKAGLPTPATHFIPPREQTGHDLARDLLTGDAPPDAILTSNGLLALGVFQAVAASGLRCPQDVALATFDNAKWTGLVSPGITVIEQPTYEIGRTAAELLLGRLSNPTRSSRCVVLPHRLIVRASTGRRE